MWSPDAVGMVIDALNQLGSNYIVTGSLASNAYGEPRGTIDADFVLHVKSDEMQRLRKLLKAHFVAEEQMAFETVTGKTQHKFRYAPTKFLIEVFEADLSDPHERSRFDRRQPSTMVGRPTFFPTAEDVIVQKLRWFKRIRRAKDRDDVRNVLIHQWKTLDWQYLEHWCREHETLDLLNEIKQDASKTIKAD